MSRFRISQHAFPTFWKAVSLRLFKVLQANLYIRRLCPELVERFHRRLQSRECLSGEVYPPPFGGPWRSRINERYTSISFSPQHCCGLFPREVCFIFSPTACPPLADFTVGFTRRSVWRVAIVKFAFSLPEFERVSKLSLGREMIITKGLKRY